MREGQTLEGNVARLFDLACGWRLYNPIVLPINHNIHQEGQLCRLDCYLANGFKLYGSGEVTEAIQSWYQTSLHTGMSRPSGSNIQSIASPIRRKVHWQQSPPALQASDLKIMMCASDPVCIFWSFVLILTWLLILIVYRPSI
jgi:hypothetical protein